MEPRQHVPVLVVGAGLGGLSAALFLGLHGVPAVVVDRHPGTSTQPKARGQMPPIMEAFAAAGVADEIAAASPPGKPEMTIVICSTVTGQVLHSFSEHFPDYSALSPAPAGMASQQRAEAAIAARAAQLGADLRFATRLESFTQDGGAVRAVLTDVTAGERYEVDAGYLVGADGHRGQVAAAAGIGSHGRASFGQTTTTLFRAELADKLPSSAVLMYYVQNPSLPEGSGAFVSTDLPGEYVAGFPADPGRTDDQTIALIRTMVGIDDLPVTLHGSSTWQIAHRVADRLSAGRVFLVGDAAHLMPPTGGQGGNTAMLDGLHLAWKLAAVINGQAGPGLLASHSDEQLPYDEAIADWQYGNMIERQRPDLADGTEPPMRIDPASGIFGYVRPAGAFVPEDGTPELWEDPFQPSGRPGTRAPHVLLHRGTVPVSTRELFYHGFVLLTGDPAWAQAGSAIATRRRLRIDTQVIGIDLLDPGNCWATAYHVPAHGAVLIRPDGVIAWRTGATADPSALDAALRTVLDR